MKNYINKVLLLGGCVLALSSCDDNSWNDKLEGFEEPGAPTDVQTLDYTLTANDYKTLAANSTNKALAGDNTSALTAVGTQCYFTDIITPQEYIPALLNDPKFPYFALSNGSALNITYNITTSLPEEVTEMANATKYTVTEADYQTVWGSETDYTNAFAPSHTAARSLPSILKTALPDAEEGDYVIVNYNTATQDPNFGSSSETTFTPSSVLGSLSSMSSGDDISFSGYVAAVSVQGPVVTDATGSIFVYSPTNNSDLKVGDQVSVDGTLGTYAYAWQITKGSTAVVEGTQTVTYPTPKTWTGEEMEQYVTDAKASGATPLTPVYSTFTGTVTISGSYTNINIDGSSIQVSAYGATSAVKAKLTDGATVSFNGYVTGITNGGKCFNVVVTEIDDTQITTQSVATAATSRAGVTVSSTNENAVYKYDGSKWAVAESTYVLSHSDYQAMGQSYDNLSGTVPADYLPILLKNKYPYAATDDTMFVVYYYYDGSATVTKCDQYMYNGTDWILNNGVITETAQFVRSNGKWNYDPSVVITLTPGRSQPLATLYFQTCVDWIMDNVTNGAAYVTSYGNNEYYCGTSAYQGNVDLRPSAARTQYSGYDSMTDDEIVALEKERFEKEVMPAALAILHPNLKPVDGVDVTVTIYFGAYYGTTLKGTNSTVIYRVTAPATFELVSCEWGD